MRDTRSVLAMLIAGINPETGEMLARDDVVRRPCVQAALADALNRMNAALAEEQPSVKLRADRAWTQEDDKLLARLWEKETSPEQLCLRLKRRNRGIRNRLLTLRLIETADEYPMPERKKQFRDAGGASRSYRFWTITEDDELREMFLAGKPLDRIAAYLQRTERAVAFELVELGLLDALPEGMA